MTRIVIAQMANSLSRYFYMFIRRDADKSSSLARKVSVSIIVLVALIREHPGKSATHCSTCGISQIK